MFRDEFRITERQGRKYYFNNSYLKQTITMRHTTPTLNYGVDVMYCIQILGIIVNIK